VGVVTASQVLQDIQASAAIAQCLAGMIQSCQPGAAGTQPTGNKKT